MAREKFSARNIVATVVMITVGVGMIVAGAIYVNQYASSRLPSSAQQATPVITVYSSTFGASVTALLDARGGQDFSLSLLDGHVPDPHVRSPSAEITDQEPVTLIVTVKDYKNFQWNISSNVDVLSLSTATRSKVSTSKSGTGRTLTFQMKLSSDSGPAVLYFAAHGESVATGGGIVAPLLPSIQSADALAGDGPISMDQLKKSNYDLQGYAIAGQVAHVDYYIPNLYIEAQATPYSNLNPTWEVVSESPPLQTTPPLQWSEVDKFFPQLRYRDTSWVEAQSQANLVGGVLIGLGSGILVTPLGRLFVSAERIKKGPAPNPRPPRNKRR